MILFVPRPTIRLEEDDEAVPANIEHDHSAKRRELISILDNIRDFMSEPGFFENMSQEELRDFEERMRTICEMARQMATGTGREA